MSSSLSININCNEAIAWAALSAKVNLMAHYPGSPVNNIEKYLKKLNRRFEQNVAFNDSLNEHVAALSAMGASFCGARSLLVMKHVGLNIAADPLNYAGYPGVKGGMVIVVGTDPGANSSTGEEDVHHYVSQFNFPLFEPCTVQECYDQTIAAYNLSESYQIPVLIFLPGRLAYNYSEIQVQAPEAAKEFNFQFEKNDDLYINVGAQAVKNHKKLVAKISEISDENLIVKRDFNSYATIGLVTRGLTYSIAIELVRKLGLEDQIDLLNLDLVYPLNKNEFLHFAEQKESIYVIEDQDGFVEQQIKFHCFNELNCEVHGKDIFPSYGEITIGQIEEFLRECFELPLKESNLIPPFDIPERLGTFCEGCPHRGSFYSIDQVLKDRNGVIGGDIGCSSLPPFRADWLLCMNAGIGISQGMAQVIKDQTIISTGGDGSFFHAGALSLLSAIQNKIDLIHIVFDNGTIAMTGHQKSPTEDSFDYHSFLTAMGVDKVIDVSPYDPNHFIESLENEMDGKGVRVFWVKGACVLKGNEFIENRRNRIYPEIDPTKCDTCSLCYEELACPAIINLKKSPEQELKIDLDRCVRCGMCHEICPNEAITIKDLKL